MPTRCALVWALAPSVPPRHAGELFVPGGHAEKCRKSISGLSYCLRLATQRLVQHSVLDDLSWARFLVDELVGCRHLRLRTIERQACVFRGRFEVIPE